MKPEKFILYNKYKDIDFPNKELIFVAFDKTDSRKPCLFLFKDKPNNVCDFSKHWNIDFSFLDNLNIPILGECVSYITISGYSYIWPLALSLKDFKPLLKDKLKNILNR